MRHRAVKAQRMRTIASVILLLWGVLFCSAGKESLAASDPLVLPTASGPSEQSAASVQALVMGASGVIYAGSFGHGIFRTMDRGTTWVRVGGGVTDPFILSLASTKDGAVYA